MGEWIIQQLLQKIQGEIFQEVNNLGTNAA